MADFARVTAIRGEGAVFAVDAQGNTRRLQEGDVLQRGETLRTTGSAQAELMMEDGRTLAVLPGQALRLDEQVADTDATPDAADAAISQAAAIDTVIQALDRGLDLSTQLEATAAGLGGAAGGGADGGSSFVQLLRLAEDVSPVAYDYGFDPLQPPAGGAGTGEVAVNEPPAVVFRDPNEGPDTTSALGVVREPGLPTGSDADANTETWTGQFVLSDPDGLPDLQGVTINGQTVAIGSLQGSVFAGASGTLAITAYDPTTGIASYAYTLTDVTTDIDGADETDVFTVTVSDGTDTSAPATLTIDILDDVPEALPNSNSVTEGGVVTGNVLLDGADDRFGADGATAGGGVVGVRSAGSDTTTAVTSGVGGAIAGLYGTLTLNANGTYAYDGNPNVVSPEGATDVFVYTIQDGDGDLSTTTLTINLANSSLMAPDDNDALVYENALDTSVTGADLAAGSVSGSLPGSGGETDSTNQLTATGGTGPYTYAVSGSPTGTYGTIQINSDGSYTYTLTSPYDSSPDADNGTHTEQNKDSFTYEVTDANGNTATGTITVDIVDDVPTAYANVNSVAEGAVVSGNVLTDGTADVFGADGAAVGGGVVGVRAAAGDTTTAVTSGVGGVIAGAYGSLTLNASGSYTYDGDPNVVPPEGAIDVFVYTVRDGDGDLSTTTLTINLANSSLMAPDDNDALVHENALDTSAAGDLAASTRTGTNPSSTGETDSTNQLMATGGTGPYTYAVSGSPTGTYGTIQINSDGSYTYTLTSPYDSTPNADDGANTEQNKDSFTYEVTDANGNTATGIITVDIVDDTPTVSVGNLAIANVADTYAGILDWNVGADSQPFGDSFTDTALVWDNPSGGFHLEYDTGASGAGQEVYNAVNDDGSVTFFTVSLHDDGTYDFELVTPEPSTYDTADILGPGVDGGSNLPSYTFESPLFNNQFELLVTGYSLDKGVLVNDTLTISATDLGVGDNVMQGNKGDVLRFSVVPVNDDAPDLETLSIHVSNTAGFNPDDLVTMTIKYVGEAAASTSQAIGIDQEITFNFDLTKTVEYVEVAPYDSTVSFKIDDIDVSYATPVFPEDYDLNFTLTGTDADGDAASTRFTVAVNTTDTSNQITGTVGNDTYWGTDSSDELVWNVGAAGADQVADFNLAPVGSGGDVLNLADLLSGESANAASLDAYLDFSANGDGQTVISVHADGTGSPVTQTITLENVQFAALQGYVGGGGSELAILTKLLADGNLKTDA